MFETIGKNIRLSARKSIELKTASKSSCFSNSLNIFLVKDFPEDDENTIETQIRPPKLASLLEIQVIGKVKNAWIFPA